MTTNTTTGTSITLTNKKRELIFFNIMLTGIIGSMMMTALITALPVIMTDLQINASTGQWLTSIYALVTAIVIPLSPSLITSVPSKRLYCSSLTLFCAGLIVCAVSSDFSMLIAGRVIQAIVAAILGPMGQVILFSIYPPDRTGSIMGWYGMAMGVAPIIAPMLTGLIIDFVGWQMVFWIVLMLMLATLLLAFAVFDNILPIAQKPFDAISFTLSAISFGGITLAIGNLGNYSFLTPQTGAVLLVGLGATMIFIWRQLRLKEPFLDVQLFTKYKTFTYASVATILLNLMLMGFSVLSPLYVQSVKSYSATFFGIFSLPGALLMATISPATGNYYDRHGIRTLLFVGSIAMLLCNLGMSIIPYEMNISIAIVLDMLCLFGMGCVTMPLITWGLSAVPTEKTADATALLNTLRSVAGAIGTTMFAGITTVAMTRSTQNTETLAMLDGLHAAYGCICVVNLLLLLIAVFGAKKQTNL